MSTVSKFLPRSSPSPRYSLPETSLETFFRIPRTQRLRFIGVLRGFRSSSRCHSPPARIATNSSLTTLSCRVTLRSHEIGLWWSQPRYSRSGRLNGASCRLSDRPRPCTGDRQTPCHRATRPAPGPHLLTTGPTSLRPADRQGSQLDHVHPRGPLPVCVGEFLFLRLVSVDDHQDVVVNDAPPRFPAPRVPDRMCHAGDQEWLSIAWTFISSPVAPFTNVHTEGVS